MRVRVALREYGETRRLNQKKTKTKIENKDNERVRRDPLRDLPEWFQEFTENLVDDSVPEHRDALASPSRELSSEPRAKVVSGKHSIYTHFPNDPNCDICLRTKITRALCRKSTGTVVPRAGKYGELTTTDHKVLGEGCASRNNHRYAVVVQDLATQWIQSYPCKTKTSQETQLSLQKFLEPTKKPKVIYSGNSLQFGKPCEDPSWNHCTSQHHTNRRLMVLRREQYAV